ncbi:serine/threonine-protein phosphatase, partial [Saccharothrix sp. MB29]|nr:serine/threonine-protein phosphatase [Saccharothrix sp. MB29]
AGHPEPMLLVGDRVVELPRDRAGLPLGVLPDSTWSGLDVPLPPGWSMLLYTDGLVEGRVLGDVERLGSERLIELIDDITGQRPDWAREPSALLDELIARVKSSTAGTGRRHGVLLISDRD